MSTLSPPPSRLPSGRHAKPPSEFAVACDNAIRALSADRHRKRLVLAGGGLAALALIGVGTLSLPGGHPQGRSGKTAADRHQAARAATPAANASQIAAAAGVGTTDEEPQAVPYFQAKDPAIAGHVTAVRWSGQFLRVYTDYPEGDANSPASKSLCQWTWDYLLSKGIGRPVVFVHGKSSDNGSVVLASKLDAGSACGVAPTQ